MKPLGWVFLFVAWTVITGLVVFCFKRILKPKPFGVAQGKPFDAAQGKDKP